MESFFLSKLLVLAGPALFCGFSMAFKMCTSGVACSKEGNIWRACDSPSMKTSASPPFWLVQTWSKLFMPIPTCSHLFTPVHNCSQVFTLVHSCSHLFVPVNTCSHRFTTVHTSVTICALRAMAVQFNSIQFIVFNQDSRKSKQILIELLSRRWQTKR